MAEAWLGCHCHAFPEDAYCLAEAASPVSREAQSRAVIVLVAVVAVDEVIGLACCFLSHHFHTHLLRWMATCQFASGRYGVSCIPSVAIQQHLERNGGCSCDSLYVTEFSGKGAGVRNLTSDMSVAKISIEIKGAMPDLRCLSEIKIWTFVLNKKYQTLFLVSQPSWSKLHKHVAIKTHLNSCDFFPVAMTGCHL